MKPKIRQEWKEKRKAIPARRRKEASHRALESLKTRFEEHEAVLSYASFGSEFDTSPINRHLVKERKLLLPRVDGEKLAIHQVRDLEKDLIKSRWGVREPDPARCPEWDPARLTLILVPAIAFDAAHHRIGYGKGLYDRFLSGLTHHAATVGIGFKEQLSEAFLPVDHLDIHLSELSLW